MQRDPLSLLSDFDVQLNKTKDRITELLIFGPSGKTFEESLLAHFPELVTVTLSGVSVRKGVWKHLGLLRRLRAANVCYNKTNCRGVSALAQCRDLRSLDVRATRANDRSVREIGKLTQLTELVFIGTAIQDIEPLSSLQDLRNLELVGTRVMDAQMETVSRLCKLEHLLLEATHITDAGVRQLATLAQLKILSVNNCPGTTSRVYQELGNIPSLEQVYVDQELEPQSIEHLRKLKNLETFFCGDTLPEDQKGELEEALGINVY